MITFEDDQLSSWSAYHHAYKRNHQQEAAAAKRKYRHTKSKWITDAEYLRRRIVAIDGEGVNRASGRHDYILLAISGTTAIHNVRRLRTMRMLDYLFENLSDVDLNVIYGASYDWNMWLQDMGRPSIQKLYSGNYLSRGVQFGPYQLKWMRGKSFTIKRDGRSVTIYDVLPFFQKPFVAACDEYLAGNPVWENARDVIVREKARRGEFTPEELPNIAAYNQLELDVLELLVAELRSRLNKVSLRPRRWDGPGAIAAALMMREGIKAHRSTDIPEFAARAARFAYFGGRFEPIKFGRHDGAVFEYDLNSAYPAALTRVPSLAGATWDRVKGDAGDHPFAIYRVRVRMPKDQGKWDGLHMRIPGPVPCRTPAGNIVYPMNAETWVWSPEMESLREYARVVPGVKYTVLETVTCTPATDVKPFGFIHALYLQRQALKAAKDGAHVGLKLGANSLYGKLCQQVGWVAAVPERRARNGKVLPARPARLPPFHQLEWGGYATSWCRAQVLRAALKDLDAVVAFETDALFTTRRLAVEEGPQLGAFEYTEFRNITYVQSGHYYGDEVQDDGSVKAVVKCRGVDRGFISRGAVEAAMFGQAPWAGDLIGVFPAALTRFMGAGVALARQWSMWGRWMTEPKRLDLQPSGKRRHYAPACGCGGPNDVLSSDGLHSTYCPATGAVVSSEYPVAWINPDPRMTQLEEARMAERDSEYLE